MSRAYGTSNDLFDSELSESEDESDSEGRESGEESEEGSDTEDSDGSEEGDENDEETENESQPVVSGESDDSDQNAESCPICLTRFSEQSLGTPDNCSHTFCLECIQEWSKNINTCPIDRTEFQNILVRKKGKIIKKVPVEVQPKEPEDSLQQEATVCEVCHHGDREDRLLLCDACDLAYHCECLDPPLFHIPIDEWFCPPCARVLRTGAMAGCSTPRSRRVIPRTRASETVRKRVQTNRRTSSTSRPSTSRSSSVSGRPKKCRKRRTYRRTIKKVVQLARTKKNLMDGSKGKSCVKGSTVIVTYRRRRKRRRRKTKTKTNVTSSAQAASYLKSAQERIAKRLSLCKSSKGGSIPDVKTKAGPSSSARKSSFSLFGSKDELLEFSDSDPPATPKPSTSQSSGSGNKTRPIVQASTSSINLLDNILASQTLLYSKPDKVLIRSDGYLAAKKSENNTAKKISKENSQTSSKTCLSSAKNGAIPKLKLSSSSSKILAQNSSPNSEFKKPFDVLPKNSSSSKKISRSIRPNQQKIAEKIPNPQSADSHSQHKMSPTKKALWKNTFHDPDTNKPFKNPSFYDSKPWASKSSENVITAAKLNSSSDKNNSTTENECSSDYIRSKRIMFYNRFNSSESSNVYSSSKTLKDVSVSSEVNDEMTPVIPKSAPLHLSTESALSDDDDSDLEQSQSLIDSLPNPSSSEACSSSALTKGYGVNTNGDSDQFCEDTDESSSDYEPSQSLFENLDNTSSRISSSRDNKNVPFRKEESINSVKPRSNLLPSNATPATSKNTSYTSTEMFKNVTIKKEPINDYDSSIQNKINCSSFSESQATDFNQMVLNIKEEPLSDEETCDHQSGRTSLSSRSSSIEELPSTQPRITLPNSQGHKSRLENSSLLNVSENSSSSSLKISAQEQANLLRNKLSTLCSKEKANSEKRPTKSKTLDAPHGKKVQPSCAAKLIKNEEPSLSIPGTGKPSFPFGTSKIILSDTDSSNELPSTQRASVTCLPPTQTASTCDFSDTLRANASTQGNDLPLTPRTSASSLVSDDCLSRDFQSVGDDDVFILPSINENKPSSSTLSPTETFSPDQLVSLMSNADFVKQLSPAQILTLVQNLKNNLANHFLKQNNPKIKAEQQTHPKELPSELPPSQPSELNNVRVITQNSGSVARCTVLEEGKCVPPKTDNMLTSVCKKSEDVNSFSYENNHGKSDTLLDSAAYFKNSEINTNIGTTNIPSSKPHGLLPKLKEIPLSLTQNNGLNDKLSISSVDVPENCVSEQIYKAPSQTSGPCNFQKSVISEVSSTSKITEKISNKMDPLIPCQNTESTSNILMNETILTSKQKDANALKKPFESGHKKFESHNVISVNHLESRDLPATQPADCKPSNTLEVSNDNSSLDSQDIFDFPETQPFVVEKFDLPETQLFLAGRGDDLPTTQSAITSHKNLSTSDSENEDGTSDSNKARRKDISLRPINNENQSNNHCNTFLKNKVCIKENKLDSLTSNTIQVPGEANKDDKFSGKESNEKNQNSSDSPVFASFLPVQNHPKMNQNYLGEVKQIKEPLSNLVNDNPFENNEKVENLTSENLKKQSEPNFKILAIPHLKSSLKAVNSQTKDTFISSVCEGDLCEPLQMKSPSGDEHENTLPEKGGEMPETLKNNSNYSDSMNEDFNELPSTQLALDDQGMSLNKFNCFKNKTGESILNEDYDGLLATQLALDEQGMPLNKFNSFKSKTGESNLNEDYDDLNATQLALDDQGMPLNKFNSFKSKTGESNLIEDYDDLNATQLALDEQRMPLNKSYSFKSKTGESNLIEDYNDLNATQLALDEQGLPLNKFNSYKNKTGESKLNEDYDDLNATQLALDDQGLPLNKFNSFKSKTGESKLNEDYDDLNATQLALDEQEVPLNKFNLFKSKTEESSLNEDYDDLNATQLALDEQGMPLNKFNSFKNKTEESKLNVDYEDLNATQPALDDPKLNENSDDLPTTQIALDDCRVSSSKFNQLENETVTNEDSESLPTTQLASDSYELLSSRLDQIKNKRGEPVLNEVLDRLHTLDDSGASANRSDQVKNKVSGDDPEEIKFFLSKAKSSAEKKEAPKNLGIHKNLPQVIMPSYQSRLTPVNRALVRKTFSFEQTGDKKGNRSLFQMNKLSCLSSGSNNDESLNQLLTSSTVKKSINNAGLNDKEIPKVIDNSSFKLHSKLLENVKGLNKTDSTLHEKFNKRKSMQDSTDSLNKTGAGKNVSRENIKQHKFKCESTENLKHQKSRWESADSLKKISCVDIPNSEGKHLESLSSKNTNKLKHLNEKELKDKRESVKYSCENVPLIKNHEIAVQSDSSDFDNSDPHHIKLHKKKQKADEQKHLKKELESQSKIDDGRRMHMHEKIPNKEELTKTSAKRLSDASKKYDFHDKTMPSKKNTHEKDKLISNDQFFSKQTSSYLNDNYCDKTPEKRLSSREKIHGKDKLKDKKIEKHSKIGETSRENSPSDESHDTSKNQSSKEKMHTQNKELLNSSRESSIDDCCDKTTGKSKSLKEKVHIENKKSSFNDCHEKTTDRSQSSKEKMPKKDKLKLCNDRESSLVDDSHSHKCKENMHKAKLREDCSESTKSRKEHRCNKHNQFENKEKTLKNIKTSPLKKCEKHIHTVQSETTSKEESKKITGHNFQSSKDDTSDLEYSGIRSKKESKINECVTQKTESSGYDSSDSEYSEIKRKREDERYRSERSKNDSSDSEYSKQRSKEEIKLYKSVKVKSQRSNDYSSESEYSEVRENKRNKNAECRSQKSKDNSSDSEHSNIKSEGKSKRNKISEHKSQKFRDDSSDSEYLKVKNKGVGKLNKNSECRFQKSGDDLSDFENSNCRSEAEDKINKSSKHKSQRSKDDSSGSEYLKVKSKREGKQIKSVECKSQWFKENSSGSNYSNIKAKRKTKHDGKDERYYKSHKDELNGKDKNEHKMHSSDDLNAKEARHNSGKKRKTFEGDEEEISDKYIKHHQEASNKGKVIKEEFCNDSNSYSDIEKLIKKEIDESASNAPSVEEMIPLSCIKQESLDFDCDLSIDSLYSTSKVLHDKSSKHSSLFQKFTKTSTEHDSECFYKGEMVKVPSSKRKRNDSKDGDLLRKKLKEMEATHKDKMLLQKFPKKEKSTSSSNKKIKSKKNVLDVLSQAAEDIIKNSSSVSINGRFEFEMVKNNSLSPHPKEIKEEKADKKQAFMEEIAVEVKMVLKPFYSSGVINKDDYKDIMRRAVPKIFSNCNYVLNHEKIRKLVVSYVSMPKYS